MRAHNIEILAQTVLFKLYQLGLKTPTRAPLHIVRSLFTVEVPELFIEKALEDLESAGLIYGSHSMMGASEYAIEAVGIKVVQEALSTKESAIAQLSELGDEWLLEAEETGPAEQSQQIPKFTKFRDSLIIALYEISNKEGLNLYPLKDLADETGMLYRDGWIFEVLTFLDEHGYGLIVKSMGGDGTAAAKLNASGLEFAEELIDESAHEPSSAEFSPIPASDRYVEIDNNSAEFRDAKTNVESATEAIRGFNEPTSYDKVQVVHELTIGQQLLKIGKVRVAAVAAIILAPLYIVYQDVAAESLRPIVEAAINAVKIWLGL